MHVQEVDEKYCISYVFKGDWKAKLRGHGQIIPPDGGSLTKVTVESDDINEDGEEKVVGTFSGLTIGGDYTLEVEEDAVLGAPHPLSLLRAPRLPLGGPCLPCASGPVQRKRHARSSWLPEGCRAGKTTSTRASASAWARTALPAPASSGAPPAPLRTPQGPRERCAAAVATRCLPLPAAAGTRAPHRTIARTGTTATKSQKGTAGRASAEHAQAGRHIQLGLGCAGERGRFFCTRQRVKLMCCGAVCHALYYPLVSGVILQTCKGSFSTTSDFVPSHTPYGFIALRCGTRWAALLGMQRVAAPIGAAGGGRAAGVGGD
jgi:hypothetical protein